MTSKELFIHCVEQRDGIFLEREKRQIIEDLEDYEHLKELMGTPIQEIMKKLKVLSILKHLIEIIPNSTTDAESVYDIRITPLKMISDKILLEIKEWLDD